MSLSGLQDAVITRIRAQVASLSNRVAAAISEEEALAQTELALPNAFVVRASKEPGETMLSPLDQEWIVRFRVLVAVSNATEERGQTASVNIDAIAADVAQALIGFAPSSVFAPILWDGQEDGADDDRRAAGCALTFRTLIMSSDL